MLNDKFDYMWPRHLKFFIKLSSHQSIHERIRFLHNTSSAIKVPVNRTIFEVRGVFYFWKIIKGFKDENAKEFSHYVEEC